MGNLLSTNPTSTVSQSIPTESIVITTTTLPNAQPILNMPATTMPATTMPATTMPATTKPLINQDLAETITNLQQTIIASAQTGVNSVSNINLNALITPQTTQSTSNFEAFTIQQPRDIYQTPIYIAQNSSPELNDYVSAYNKSIALLDDPNLMSQANFDAYIHLQDKKIEKLQESIASFPTNPQQQNNSIRAIKNLKTSIGLNVEPYPDPATKTSLPAYYKGNGSKTYPNYLIYTNNGCLQYTHNNVATKTPATWSVQSCNSNLAGQRFNMQQVNNMEQYNSIIRDPNNASYKITDPNSSIFGFYVVNPEGQNSQCLQLNGDGLSVMPCNMDSSQRFKTYYHPINP
jgi:hypothetical protein